MYLFLTRCVTWALQKQEVPVWEKGKNPCGSEMLVLLTHTNIQWNEWNDKVFDLQH